MRFMPISHIRVAKVWRKKFLHIYHMQEYPKAKLEYFIPTDVEINGRAYMIVDADHITLMLAEKY